MHHFDSSREALVAGLKAAPWLVKPNRRELEIWAGRKLPEMKDVIDAAHALREQGIAHVVISLGEEGALWVNASGEWIAKHLQWKWSAPLRRRFDGRRPDLRPADA